MERHRIIDIAFHSKAEYKCLLAAMKSNLEVLQKDTGIVIPICLPARIDTAQGELLLAETVR